MLCWILHMDLSGYLCYYFIRTKSDLMMESESMKRLTEKYLLLCAFAILAAMLLSSCKPKYVSPLESPVMTTAASDDPYELDFVQFNNDIIDAYNEGNPYSFVNSLTIDGSNDPKQITFTVDIKSGVVDAARELFITDLLRKAGDEANLQDLRFSLSTDDDFGSFYKTYGYTLKITCEGKDVVNETIAAGADIPHDPSLQMTETTAASTSAAS